MEVTRPNNNVGTFDCELKESPFIGQWTVLGINEQNQIKNLIHLRILGTRQRRHMALWVSARAGTISMTSKTDFYEAKTERLAIMLQSLGYELIDDKPYPTRSVHNLLMAVAEYEFPSHQSYHLVEAGNTW